MIPVGTAELALLPEVVLRRLFDAFRLEIHFDKPTSPATCKVTITGDTLQATRQVTATALQRVEEGAAEELPICAVPPARCSADGQESLNIGAHQELVITEGFHLRNTR
ncbi:hypothetical protein [Spongiactinospora sp. 9N601]|uniref:hypothetical protein n=1 Tax=Spongiactinospora sp. 9N601 TaxID=3375149 RepID=UPI00378A756A